MRLRRTAAALAAALAICFGAATAQAQHTPRAAPVSHDAQTQELAPPSAAPTTNVEVAPTGDAFAPSLNRISIVSLFVRADAIVKAVFVLLVLASLWSWAIIINKWMALGTLKRRASKFERTFWSGLSLDELYQQFSQRNDHPFAAIFTSALREWRRAFEGGPPRESLLSGVKDRIDKAMNVTIQRETEGIERQLGFLATVGATAPFVGLFGTVWGIMIAFQGLSNVKEATIAMVAPGISEALIATAMGLFAAIPAVWAYNRYSTKLERVTTRFDTFVEEFSSILQRQAHVDEP